MANLVEIASNMGSFKTLMTVVEAAGLLEVFKNSNPHTVFAPTDEAFSQIPTNTLAELMEDVPKLKKIVAYHVVFGDVRTDDLRQLEEAPTVEGSVVALETSQGEIHVNDATILQPDILADNGVIHVIDKVLMPAMVEKQLS
jgi:uncharacterized surface protein with fasciclin (FAS1) repeats